MAIYLVGDLQGCYAELIALLAKASFDVKHDTLYLAGDLVARGPDSLATIRFIKSLGSAAKVVLGNHDLHLLSVHCGLKKAKAADKLAPLLSAPDIDELMDWLAQQPLIQQIPAASDGLHQAYLSHAGLSPQWSIDTALVQAGKVHEKLCSPARKDWLAIMYGQTPNSWSDCSSDEEIFRYSVNALTRMRFCFLDGSLEFQEKSAPKDTQAVQDNLIKPWYELTKLPSNTAWLFGHWASLMGQCPTQNIFALDTGCVWGNHLTMLRWHDKKLFTEPAHVQKSE